MSDSLQRKNRELAIFLRLLQGEYISVQKLAREYQVSEKSISRNIRDLKNAFCDNREQMGQYQILYSHRHKAYYLETDSFLTSRELLAVVKILIAGRALNEEQMKTIIHKLETFLSIKDRQTVHELVLKELHHYAPVGSDCKNVVDTLWMVSQSIREQKEISIEYYKMDRSKITRRVKPVAIVFSEFYFYMIALHDEDGEEATRYYRVDRIIGITKHRTGFQVDYIKRFDEGELKNKIQYMWPGQGTNRTVTFEFDGPSVQAVLDKLPGAEIIGQEGTKYTIQANVFGGGIKMFLLSQGAWVKVLSPPSLVEEMQEEIQKMQGRY